MMWQIVPVRNLALRRWDNEWVVTDTVSGDTHLLGFTAGKIVKLLQSGRMATNELAMMLQLGQEGVDSLQECLDALVTQEIIEPCPN